jgi:hypothetical protein
MKPSQQKDHIERRNTTQAVDAQLGQKYCRSCHAHRALLGGSVGQDRQGRPTWVCRECAERIETRKAEQRATRQSLSAVPEVSAPPPDLLATGGEA